MHDDGRSLTIAVETPRWQADVRLELSGRFNAFNALAAIGVGEALGLDPEQMRGGLAGVRRVKGRMEPIDAGQPFDVFVDFAHTPGALAAALDALAPIAAARGGSLISLFGSPGARDIAKRPMMGRAAGERSRVVVLTDDDPRTEDEMGILEEIAPGAIEAGRTRERDLFLIPDRRAAIRHALEQARPGDIVLLAGKGHESTLAMAQGPDRLGRGRRGARRVARDGLHRRQLSAGDLAYGPVVRTAGKATSASAATIGSGSMRPWLVRTTIVTSMSAKYHIAP